MCYRQKISILLLCNGVTCSKGIEQLFVQHKVTDIRPSFESFPVIKGIIHKPPFMYTRLRFSTNSKTEATCRMQQAPFSIIGQFFSWVVPHAFEKITYSCHERGTQVLTSKLTFFSISTKKIERIIFCPNATIIRAVLFCQCANQLCGRFQFSCHCNYL